MVIAHLFLFCPSFQRLWSLRKSLKIHFYSSQSVTVTFCFQLRNCNTSPYNNHSQVGKVLGTSTSELCEGKRISWKYPQKTNKQTNQPKKQSVLKFGLELAILSIQEPSLFPQKCTAYEDKPLSPTNVF